MAPASGRTPGASLADAGGRPRLTVARSSRAAADGQEPLASRRAHSRRHNEPDDRHLELLVREWLELRMMGRSPRTMEWYRQKMDWYLSTGQAQSLQEFTAYELKGYLGELRDRNLADQSMASSRCCGRSHAGPIARAIQSIPPYFKSGRPKVEQKEVETYTREQLETIFGATPPGWPTTAVKILLGTGMRLSELCGPIIEDFEDDRESAFLKVREKHGRSSWQLDPSSRRRFLAGADREEWRGKGWAGRSITARTKAWRRLSSCLRQVWVLRPLGTALALHGSIRPTSPRGE